MELLNVEEDVAQKFKLNTQYYHRAKLANTGTSGGSNGECYKITAQDMPFGLQPQKLVALNWKGE